jgi:hypothetical protein
MGKRILRRISALIITNRQPKVASGFNLSFFPGATAAFAYEGSPPFSMVFDGEAILRGPVLGHGIVVGTGLQRQWNRLGAG